MRRTFPFYLTVLWGVIAFSQACFGQGGPPAGAPRPTPGFDLSGYWTAAIHEDALERGGGPETADYGGFPINEAARLFGLSYNVSRVTLRHHQCDGYVAPYSVRSIGNARAWEERDPHTQRLIAIHWYNQTFEGSRTIWMDGRPHPPPYAPHTWMGFSTGTFVGNALVVHATHIKQGWLRRNGLPESDQATHSRVLCSSRRPPHLHVGHHRSRVPDRAYRQNYRFRTPAGGPRQLAVRLRRRRADFWKSARSSARITLLGQNPFVKEQGEKYKIPMLGYLGGSATMYPEFVAKMRTATEAEGLAETRPGSGAPPASRAVDPEPHDGEIHVLPLRNNVYLLLGDGGNIVVQVGDEGAFVVDSGSGALAGKTIAAIRKLSDKPIQFIANTGYRADHTGGNAALRAAGSDPSVVGSFFALGFADAGIGATIMAHQNVQNHMYALNMPAAGIPSDTFLDERRRHFHNGDAIEMFQEPNAVTDADSIVQFRRADIIVTGDIFTTTQFPFIDVQNGGSVQGEIKALNDILNRTVYQHESEGGTIVIPGHGYVCDEHEVVEYRDMVAIVRDRVQAMIKSGATVEQVKAARPTADYDSRYGATSGPWTTAMFVEAVYNSLKQAPK